MQKSTETICEPIISINYWGRREFDAVGMKAGANRREGQNWCWISRVSLSIFVVQVDTYYYFIIYKKVKMKCVFSAMKNL